MGVYIKGMEMPKSCDECPMFNLDIDGGCYCTKYFVIRKKGQDRPDWCPFVPVPEHGRLIDADALAKTLGITDMDCYKCAWGNHGFCGRGGDFNDACEAIEDAPTIIPADPAEEGE